VKRTGASALGIGLMPGLSLSARLKTRVEDGRPSRPRVYCGWQACGTLVAWVGVKGASFAFDEGAGYPHGHEVQWASGFRRGEDKIVRLSRRATARWRQAKRQGVPWKQYVDRGGVRQRRPYVIPQQRPSTRPYSAEPGGTFVAPEGSWVRDLEASDRYEVTSGPLTFICPVCERSSVVDIPDAQGLIVHERQVRGRCSTCLSNLPLIDGDYVIDPSS
jgi:hypothetical protein